MSERKERTSGVYKPEEISSELSLGGTSPAQGIRSYSGRVGSVLPWPHGCSHPVAQNTLPSGPPADSWVPDWLIHQAPLEIQDELCNSLIQGPEDQKATRGQVFPETEM